MIGEGKTFAVTQSFTFDGAHHLTEDHREHYGDLHGHSWTCEVTIKGEPSPKKGWVIDLEQLENALRKVAFLLDHKYHNKIVGLETPTMENMSVWIAEAVWSFLVGNRLDSKRLWISEVAVQRTTIGESCSYQPTNLSIRPKKEASPELGINFRAMHRKSRTGSIERRVARLKGEVENLEKSIEKEGASIRSTDRRTG